MAMCLHLQAAARPAPRTACRSAAAGTGGRRAAGARRRLRRRWPIPRWPAPAAGRRPTRQRGSSGPAGGMRRHAAAEAGGCRACCMCKHSAVLLQYHCWRRHVLLAAPAPGSASRGAHLGAWPEGLFGSRSSRLLFDPTCRMRASLPFPFLAPSPPPASTEPACLPTWRLRPACSLLNSCSSCSSSKLRSALMAAAC